MPGAGFLSAISERNKRKKEKMNIRAYARANPWVHKYEKIECVTLPMSVIGCSIFGLSVIAIADGWIFCGVIIVLLMNLTCGYARKYAASPPTATQRFGFSIQCQGHSSHAEYNNSLI